MPAPKHRWPTVELRRTFFEFLFMLLSMSLVIILISFSFVIFLSLVLVIVVIVFESFVYLIYALGGIYY